MLPLYVLEAALAKNSRGRRVFTPLQEDIIVFTFFFPQNIGKLVKESGLSPDQFAKLKKKTLRKFEHVICTLVKLDLKQSIFSPHIFCRKLKAFWGKDDFPLKRIITKIFVDCKAEASEKEFKEARGLQNIAERYGRPWIYLKKSRVPVKRGRPKGIYKNADERIRQLIMEIDREEQEKRKLIAIICEQDLAEKLLKKFEEEFEEKILKEA